MNKNILITGGSDGLGKTLAAYLSCDNNVVILATNEEKLKEVSIQNNCKYKVCDVSNYGVVESVINEIIDEYGKIDVLINNAGLWIQDELDCNDSNRIASVVDVNLLGVINCSKAVIPSMKNNNGGLIININSQAGINHKAERTVYNATKWGVTSGLDIAMRKTTIFNDRPQKPATKNKRWAAWIDAVKQEVPPLPWHQAVAKTIGIKLSLSSNVVARIIQYLAEKGEI